jgi:hypothetical protein
MFFVRIETLHCLRPTRFVVDARGKLRYNPLCHQQQDSALSSEPSSRSRVLR